MTKTAIHLNIGDHILSGDLEKEYRVIEVRLDPFAAGSKWVIVRLRELANPENEGEVVCNSQDDFKMAETVSQE